MYTSVKNEIIKDVLTQDQINAVYSEVEKANKKYVMDLFSQNITDFNLPQDIAARVISLAQATSGIDNLEIAEYQFARYKNTQDSGKDLKPNLFPHTDMFPEPRLTFDYQVGGNTSWPLVVMNNQYELGNNQALTFSGTHQPHWRTHKDFSDDEYIDMVFFHLRQKGASPISDDERGMIDKTVQDLKKQYEEEKK